MQLISVYRFLGSCLRILVPLYLFIRTRRGKEDPSRKNERYGHATRSRPTGSLIWIHAASVGETQAILPLIRLLSNEGLKVLLTTGTKTSARIANKNLPTGAIHQYAPLDIALFVSRFLDYWRPGIAIFVESELWPVTLFEAQKRSIPTLLVNARMSERSFARWRFFRSISNGMLKGMSAILAQYDKDTDRFRSLGASNVLTVGNIKLDAPALRVDEELLAHFLPDVQKRSASWTAASTHAGEEAIVIEAHKILSEDFADLLTLLVPRHPDRCTEIRTLIEESGLKVQMRSDFAPLEADTDILLVDTIGELGTIYKLSDVAFIGGSLVENVGGHNPIEAIQANAAVLQGAHCHNFAVIHKLLTDAEAIVHVEKPAALPDALKNLFLSEEMKEGFIAKARAAIDSEIGALDALMQTLTPFVEDLRSQAHPDLETQPELEMAVAAGQPAQREKFLKRTTQKIMSPKDFWWKEKTWAAFFLIPFSLIWGYFGSRRMKRTPQRTAPVPVICVGNFVIGGAGKTPIVICLVETLRQLGWKPAIIARSYKANIKGPHLVDPENDNALDVGDEPLFLAQTIPTIITVDRAAAIDLVDPNDYNILVLDDGFQSPALKKDINLVVVDAEVGVGNGRPLPSGPLRAFLKDQLAAMSAIILVGKGNQSENMVRRAARMGRPVFRAITHSKPDADLKDKKLLAYSGIGRPEKFFNSLDGLGLNVAETRSYPDHYAYDENDAQKLLQEAAEKGLTLVTTHKDHVRLKGFPGTARSDLLTESIPVSYACKFSEDRKFREYLKNQLEKITR